MSSCIGYRCQLRLPLRSGTWILFSSSVPLIAPYGTRHIFAAGSHFPPAAFTCSRSSFSTYPTTTRTGLPFLRRGEGCQGFSSITSSTVFNRTPRSSSYRDRTYRSELPKRSVETSTPWSPMPTQKTSLHKQQFHYSLQITTRYHSASDEFTAREYTAKIMNCKVA